ncbi:phosphopantetheinyl transferase [Verticillium dahliae VdLs.17]|uniref:holo-[acyl-carrier-protein] synthase n=1 Tax=Verticillium dahliae (strain VdLs.17 / ATCC MYA-4575 / FGSC 10137) TaxID=498257 RepID=G2WWD2_VERDV|nr:phosphopantetheinyl transferase [Verticillium dahliae VdLs.17]EGY19902.1 phosphopantetheinyl transferase [Verticillium dahliae VdLs.17]
MSSSSSDRPHLVQWILDTRTLWPEATRTKDLEHAASRALALLTPDERAGVLRFYHVRDAKLSLGSHLLKRHATARFCGVPWSRAVPIRDTPTAKPTWRDPAGREPLRFNVSHQAGLVALIAVHDDQDPGALEWDVGVDVVCTSERRVRDRATIAAEGWPHFVDVHADVLSPREVAYLQHGIMAPVHQLPGRPGDGASADEVADFQLRCFYALWCLREATPQRKEEGLALRLGDFELVRLEELVAFAEAAP